MSNRPKRQVPSSTKVGAGGTGSGGKVAAARQGGGGTPVWVRALLAAVVVVAGVLAVVVTSGGDDDTTTTAAGGSGGSAVVADPADALVFGEPTVEGQPLPQAPDGGEDPAIGMEIPTVTSQTLTGEPVTIAPDGTPKIVMFVAHWCPHCQDEVPRLVSWFDENGVPTDVELYTVATATNEAQDNFPPGAWLAAERWPVTTLVDDPQGTIAEAYGLAGFPYFVVVGAYGQVLDRTSGEQSESAWEALVATAAGSAEGGEAALGGASDPG